MQPNQGVQLTPLARLVGWARFTRQSATACWQHDNPQPSAVPGNPALLVPHRSAARALPGNCLVRRSSTLQTPASGAADARRCAAQSASSSLRIVLQYNSTDRSKIRSVLDEQQ